MGGELIILPEKRLPERSGSLPVPRGLGVTRAVLAVGGARAAILGLRVGAFLQPIFLEGIAR